MGQSSGWLMSSSSRIPAWQLLPYERSAIFSAEDMGSGVSSEFGVKA